MSTLVNPPVPFSGPIPGGLSNGKMIIIQAKVPQHQNSFSINLCVGGNVEPLSDTGLHFNPRFNDRCIVRNSLQHGNWGGEERQGGMPLKKGTPFEIIILVNQANYKVSINGKHYTDFCHRIPKEALLYLVIVGGLEVSFIKFEGGNQPPPYSPPPPVDLGSRANNMYTPGGFGGGMGAGPFPNAFGAGPVVNPPYAFGAGPVVNPTNAFGAGPVVNPPVPYLVNMPGGLYPGRTIYISGIPHPNPSRFSVNLQCGPHDSCDVGMTFDARFNFGDCRNTTVRNHKVNNSWGNEERHGSYFPFLPQAPFDMIILVEPASIKVAVNNQHFCEFAHRIQPLGRVDWLNITGDVQLTSVRLQ